ncbi:ADP-ribosylglycohydrolase family protein [Moraxella catarrhalis]|uniref:ADP-ribosylglycohydrolase family protein n=1 Tax=Moraxella catarrhalis TaxID=480 RepID=UPI00155E5B9B|nr:hypothetical protein [Moraxella catarrhalis]
MTFIPPIALLPKLNQSVIFNSNLLYQVKVTHCACFSIATWMQRDDTDTIADICRKIAGAYHGIDNIPMHWLDKLHDHNHIIDLGRLYLLPINNLHTIKLNKSSFRKCYDQLSRTCPIH